MKESLEKLILFSIFLLETEKKNSSFEDIIEKCFSLFPENFSFDEIKKWPDSRKIDRPLRNLRKRGMISGNPNYFSLTKKGKEQALEINKKFKQKKLF